MILSRLKHSVEGLLHLLYPKLCVLCNRSIGRDETALCLHCIFRLPRTGFHNHPDNKTASVFIGRVPIAHATSFVLFTKEGMVQDLLHAFKYKGRRDIGILLGRLLAAELRHADWISNIDCIIALPLHKRKERQRGYNQAAVFAQGLADELNLPFLKHVIIRTKFTTSQTKKSRMERMRNVSDVFKVTGTEKISDRHILLVDDVLTTGATLESCALELLKAAGVKVSIATIAIAGN